MDTHYGYACINETLKAQKIFTNRTIRKKTLDKHGISLISDLALKNVKDLKTILEWNLKHDILFFRVSSNLIPWGNKISMYDFPDIEEIKHILKECGDFAHKHNMRLSSHPGQFNLLSSPKETVVDNTFSDLIMHANLFDEMGLSQTHFNKINIHMGGSYGDKEGSAKTWIKNFKRLPHHVRSRLTVENDDKSTQYSVKDLYHMIHEEVGVPIVFDYHHHRFQMGGLNEEEALNLACSTWGDIKPIIHYSESKSLHEYNAKLKPQAHSDYVDGPIRLYGKNVDVMIEAKQKERAVLKYKAKLKTGLEVESSLDKGFFFNFFNLYLLIEI